MEEDKMSIKDAIEILKNMNDGFTFQDCRVCTIKHKYDEEKGVCKSKECDYLNAIENVLAELKRQKFLAEDEEKIRIKYAKELEKSKEENFRLAKAIKNRDKEWKDKIIAKIEELRNDIEKNNYDGHILDEMYLKIQVLEELLGGE